jgi:hypothetical protein
MRWLEYPVFLALVVALAEPAGLYLARVFEGEATWLDPVLRPIEAGLHRLMGIDRRQEMTPGVYFASFLLFGLVGAAGLFVLLSVQRLIPGGPADRYLTTPMTPDLAANTAISFATTTTWQAYGGETTLRYLTQAAGLVSQNFLAGASGLAVGIAFIRGLARQDAATLGSFWVDLIRAVLWVLLPIALKPAGRRRSGHFPRGPGRRQRAPAATPERRHPAGPRSLAEHTAPPPVGGLAAEAGHHRVGFDICAGAFRLRLGPDIAGEVRAVTPGLGLLSRSAGVLPEGLHRVWSTSLTAPREALVVKAA